MGVSRSGTPFMMAKDIAKSIQKKIKENNSNNNTIRSSQIKEFVTEELKSRNENVIAESFSGYSKNTITELSANHKYDSKAGPTQRSPKRICQTKRQHQSRRISLDHQNKQIALGYR